MFAEARLWSTHNPRSRSECGRVACDALTVFGRFFLQAVAELAQKGFCIQPGSAQNFYLALGASLRQQQEPWSFSALIAVAQAAYRLGQFYQRQLSRLAVLGSS